MQCPRCGDEIDPAAPCRRCQQAELLRSLAGDDTAGVAEKECPRCGKATRAAAAVCDKCGYTYPAEGSPAERYQAQVAEEARTVPSALTQTVSPYLSWAVIGVCLLLMAGGAWLILTASLPGGEAAGADEAILRRSHRSATQSVTYQVTGTAARAMVAYRDASGQAEVPPEAVSLPWTQALAARSGADLSLSARPVGGGTVTCTISTDGKIRKQAGTPSSDGLTTVSDTLAAK